MILSQAELRQAVEDGEIKFEPSLEERQWQAATINLRLGLKFTKWKSASAASISLAEGFEAVAALGLWSEKILKENDEHGNRETYPLPRDSFVMAQTYEKVSVPTNLIAMIEGRSSYARCGLTVHQTAPFLQPGFSGRITLEIRNGGSLNISLIPIVEMPCQIAFLRLTSRVPDEQAYGARPTDSFQNQDRPIGGRSA
jgi:dCTP deaminase